MVTGDKRSFPTRRGGMTVLGKIVAPKNKVAVPRPINLPSQRSENRGLDPNVEIVPKGTLGWQTSGRSPPTSSNAWGTPSSFSPPNAGPWSRSSVASARPSSGGSGTRPSTAGSDQSHEPPTPTAWGSSTSRPSSASGILGQSRSQPALNRPCSAEARPSSSQRSRFAEPSAESGGVWGSSAGPHKLVDRSHQSSQFSLTTVDFPSLGSDKNPDLRPHQANAPLSQPFVSDGSVLKGQSQLHSPDWPDGSQIRGHADTWKRDTASHGLETPHPLEVNQHTDGSYREAYATTHSHAPETWHSDDQYRASLPPKHRDEDWHGNGSTVPAFGPPPPHGRFAYNPAGYFPMECRPIPCGQGHDGHSGYNRHGEGYGPYTPQSMVPSRPGLPLGPIYGNQMPYNSYHAPPGASDPFYGNSINERDMAMRIGGGTNLYSGYPPNQGKHFDGTKFEHTGPESVSYRSDNHSLTGEKSDSIAYGGVDINGAKMSQQMQMELNESEERDGSKVVGTSTNRPDASLRSSSSVNSRVDKRSKEMVVDREYDWNAADGKHSICKHVLKDRDEPGYEANAVQEVVAPSLPSDYRASDRRGNQFQARNYGASEVQQGRHLENDRVEHRVSEAQLQSIPGEGQGNENDGQNVGMNQNKFWRRNVSAEKVDNIGRNRDRSGHVQVQPVAKGSDLNFSSDGGKDEQNTLGMLYNRDRSESSLSTNTGNQAFKVNDKVQLLKRSDNNNPAESFNVDGNKEAVQVPEKEGYKQEQRESVVTNTRSQKIPTRGTSNKSMNMNTSTGISKSRRQSYVQSGTKQPSENADDKLMGDNQVPNLHGSQDYETQRVRLKELAVQRAKQLQKEEDERTKEQMAKARAKLEELNRKAAYSQEGVKSGSPVTPGSESYESLKVDFADVKNRVSNSEGVAAKDTTTNANAKMVGAEKMNVTKDTVDASGNQSTIQGHASGMNMPHNKIASGKEEKGKPVYVQKSSKPIKEDSKAKKNANSRIGVLEDTPSGSNVSTNAVSVAVENAITDTVPAVREVSESIQQKLAPSPLAESRVQHIELSRDDSKKVMSTNIVTSQTDGTSQKNMTSNSEAGLSGVDDAPTTKKKKSNRYSKAKHKFDKFNAGNTISMEHENTTVPQSKDYKEYSDGTACKSNQEVSKCSESLNGKPEFSSSGADHLDTKVVENNVPADGQAMAQPKDEKSNGRTSFAKPHFSKRQHRGLQESRGFEKSQSVWVPTGNQNVQASEKHSDQTSTQVQLATTTTASSSSVPVQHPSRSKRAEIERYVPKPVAKEQAQNNETRQQANWSTSAQVNQSKQGENPDSHTVVDPLQSLSSPGESKGQMASHRPAKQNVSWRQRSIPELSENNKSSVSHQSDVVHNVSHFQNVAEDVAVRAQANTVNTDTKYVKRDHAGNRQKAESDFQGSKAAKQGKNDSYMEGTNGTKTKQDKDQVQQMPSSENEQRNTNLKDQDFHPVSKREQGIPDRFYQVNRMRSRSSKIAFRPVQQTEGNSASSRPEMTSHEREMVQVDERVHLQQQRPRSSGSWAPKKQRVPDEEHIQPQREIPISQIEIGQIKLGSHDVACDEKSSTLSRKQLVEAQTLNPARASSRDEKKHDELYQNAERKSPKHSTMSSECHLVEKQHKNSNTSSGHRQAKPVQGHSQQSRSNDNVVSVGANIGNEDYHSTQRQYGYDVNRQPESSPNQLQRQDINKQGLIQDVKTINLAENYQDSEDYSSLPGSRRSSNWHNEQRNNHHYRARDRTQGRRGRYVRNPGGGSGMSGNEIENKTDNASNHRVVVNATRGAAPHQIAG